MADGTPTLDGFKEFVSGVMGVPDTSMPNDAQLGMCFRIAMDWVLPVIRCVAPDLYDLCVYNYAASYLIKFAQDATGLSCSGNPDAPKGYWATVRSTFGMGTTTVGLIQSSANGPTSQSWMIPDSMKNLSLADLEALKNPYGAFALSIQQQYGEVWGLA